MRINLKLNGLKISDEVSADTTLYSFLRKRGCYSVKCGCETTNCGLCTVIMNNKPVLSCAVLAARADGAEIETLEGLRNEAEEFGLCLADEDVYKRQISSGAFGGCFCDDYDCTKDNYSS